MSTRWGDHGHEDRHLHVDQPGHAGQVKWKEFTKQAGRHPYITDYWDQRPLDSLDNTKTIQSNRDVKMGGANQALHTKPLRAQTCTATLSLKNAPDPDSIWTWENSKKDAVRVCWCHTHTPMASGWSIQASKRSHICCKGQSDSRTTHNTVKVTHGFTNVGHHTRRAVTFSTNKKGKAESLLLLGYKYKIRDISGNESWIRILLRKYETGY